MKSLLQIQEQLARENEKNVYFEALNEEQKAVYVAAQINQMTNVELLELLLGPEKT